MQVDEKEFFREATLRICGSLDVETFLYESFMYIRNFIPADNVALTHYYPDKRKQVALATASAEGGSLLNLAVSIPSDVHQFMRRPDIQTVVVDKAEMHATATPWISKGLMDKDSSMLALRLIVSGDIVGAVIFLARRSGKFSQEHADLLTLLREPFAIALSNTIRYQELLELKELLVEDNRFLHSEMRQAAGGRSSARNSG